MQTCEELTELVTDYLEGRLGWWDRVSFQLHLGLCGGCREYLRQMRETVETLGRVPDDPLPDDIRDELLERFRGWKGGA